MREFDEMKLARVIDACGNVDGRVKLQKIVYLLKAMGYVLPFDDFMIRQYGPYSRAVACAVDLLTGSGFVECREEQVQGCFSDRREPATRYTYQVKDSLKSLLQERFDVPAPQGRPPISDVAAPLRGIDRSVLEVAATKLYLEQEDQLSGDELNAELTRLKGHLKSSFADANEHLKDWKSKGWL